jgi:hypothetical protein
MRPPGNKGERFVNRFQKFVTEAGPPILVP